MGAAAFPSSSPFFFITGSFILRPAIARRRALTMAKRRAKSAMSCPSSREKAKPTKRGADQGG